MDRRQSNLRALYKRSDRSSLVGVKRIHPQSLLITVEVRVDGASRWDGDAVAGESFELTSRSGH
jgi:hypothetical protein